MLVLHLADRAPVRIDVDQDRAALRLRLRKNFRVKRPGLRRQGGRGYHDQRGGDLNDATAEVMARQNGSRS